MTNAAFSLADLDDASVTVALPADVVRMLTVDAKSSRKPMAAVLREFLQDRADAREGARIIRRIDAGKEKVTPAHQVYKELGI